MSAVREFRATGLRLSLPIPGLITRIAVRSIWLTGLPLVLHGAVCVAKFSTTRIDRIVTRRGERHCRSQPWDKPFTYRIKDEIPCRPRESQQSL